MFPSEGYKLTHTYHTYTHTAEPVSDSTPIIAAVVIVVVVVLIIAIVIVVVLILVV